MPKIRVLIVDDSLFFQEILVRFLEKDPSIEVVGRANDPFEARDLILELNPDVLTCDIEMPKMSGIAFLKQLIPQYPIPTIVISSVDAAVFDAMSAGAVDFIVKPNVQVQNDLEYFAEQLIRKVKSAGISKVKQPGLQRPLSSPMPQGSRREKVDLLAVGASTGGTEAIETFLQGLSVPIPGMVIVQHIPPIFSTMFAERLNRSTPFQVKEACSGDWVEPNSVYIAPGDQHLRVKKWGTRYKLDCYAGEKVNGHCPSVDVLFESVADQAGSCSIGVILTGMGNDGARGLLTMKRKGARTLGQDEASSVVYGMPRVAYELGAVERVLSLHDLPRAVSSII